MSAAIEEQLEKIPVINWMVRILKKIKLKAFEGLSLYDLIEMYLVGIVKGTLSSRASFHCVQPVFGPISVAYFFIDFGTIHYTLRECGQ